MSSNRVGSNLFEMPEIAKVWVWVSFPHSSSAVARAAMCLGDTIKISRLISGLEMGWCPMMTDGDWLDGFAIWLFHVVPVNSLWEVFLFYLLVSSSHDSASLLVVSLGFVHATTKRLHLTAFLVNGEDMDIISWYVFIFFFSVSICIYHFVVILGMKKQWFASSRSESSEICHLRRHTPRIGDYANQWKVSKEFTSGVMFLSRYRTAVVSATIKNTIFVRMNAVLRNAPEQFDSSFVDLDISSNHKTWYELEGYQMILDWNICIMYFLWFVASCLDVLCDSFPWAFAVHSQTTISLYQRLVIGFERGKRRVLAAMAAPGGLGHGTIESATIDRSI